MNVEDEIIKFEIEVATFIVNNNLPLSITEPLVVLLRKANPKIVAKMHLGRKKCTNLVKKVIAPSYRQSAVDIMKESPYSLLADESTDVASKKSLAVFARTLIGGRVASFLYQLVEIADGREETLFEEPIKERWSSDRELYWFCV